MCYRCDSGATTTSGIVWALPVRITEFGAHLQAYLEQKPVITALRLCHRFGQGGEAFIAKLPKELIDMVEEELLMSARQRALANWEGDFACFENRCDSKTHLAPDELEEMREGIRMDFVQAAHDGLGLDECMGPECRCADLSDEDLDDIVDDMLHDNMCEADFHWDTKQKWTERVSQCRRNRTCPAHADNLQSDAQKGFAPYDKVSTPPATCPPTLLLAGLTQSLDQDTTKRLPPASVHLAPKDPTAHDALPQL